MSHPVLYLGGPLDGTRAVVDQLLPHQVVSHWNPDAGTSDYARYRLQPVEGDRGLAGHVYVRHGLDPLAQLLHGYREARA